MQEGTHTSDVAPQDTPCLAGRRVTASPAEAGSGACSWPPCVRAPCAGSPPSAPRLGEEDSLLVLPSPSAPRRHKPLLGDCKGGPVTVEVQGLLVFLVVGQENGMGGRASRVRAAADTQADATAAVAAAGCLPPNVEVQASEHQHPTQGTAHTRSTAQAQRQHSTRTSNAGVPRPRAKTTAEVPSTQCPACTIELATAEVQGV